MKTKTDVILYALRWIGVVAGDNAADANEAQAASDALDGLFAELQKEALSPWSPVTGIADAAFIPMGQWLGAEIAPSFGLGTPVSPSRAKLRLMAVVRSDNREPTEPEYF